MMPTQPMFLLGLALSGAASAADTWTELAPGLRLLERTTSGPNQHIVAATVDLCGAGLVARATRYEERRQVTSAWGAAVDAEIAINGAFFSYTDYDTSGLSVGDGAPWPTGSDWVHGSAVAFASRGRTEIFDADRPLPAAGEDWWREVVPGDPVLIDDGVILSEACYSHMCERHPRSAIGLSADARTAILVAVDGRSGAAAGMTRAELAALMLELGAHEALNFDGGGSTTLWSRVGGVHNAPSDGSERVVASHLGFVPGDPQCCTPTPVAGAVGTFGDLPPDHWALPHAEALYAAGVTRGCSADPLLFCPDCAPDRATFAVLLQRAGGLPETGSTLFSDLPAEDPRAGSVAALADGGFTTGCGGGLFCPDRIVSRLEAATLIARVAGFSPAAAPTGRFTDLSPSEAAVIEPLAEACITSGCGPDTFCPTAELSRAEAAALLNRAFRLDGRDPCGGEDTGGAEASGDGGTDAGTDAGAGADGAADGAADGGGADGSDGAEDDVSDVDSGDALVGERKTPGGGCAAVAWPLLLLPLWAQRRRSRA
jgi:hypothetical protein